MTVESTLLNTETIVIIGAIVGTAARTLFPYWEKLRENPDIIFERKFLGTAIVSFVAAVAIGIGIFPTLLEGVANSDLSLAGVFATTALAAFGLNAGTNMALSGARTKSGTATAGAAAVKPSS